METFFKNKNLMELINRWKKHLIIISIISIAIGAFISSPIVITPKYKSSAIIYPVNISVYSKESTTEQMLQVFNSNDIKEKMLNAFNLAYHYKLDKKDTQFYSSFLSEFKSNVNISKTEYESVEITVSDENPKIACNMVDSLIAFFDQKMAILHKQKTFEMLKIKSEELQKKKIEVDTLEKKQKKYKIKYGIIDIGLQTKELTRGYLNLVNSGKKGSSAANEIDTILKNFKEIAEEYNHNGGLVYAAQNEYNAIKNEYEKHFTEYNKNITYSMIVENPFPADKKSYPIRWIVVAITVITSLIFSIIVIAVIESKQKA